MILKKNNNVEQLKLKLYVLLIKKITYKLLLFKDYY